MSEDFMLKKFLRLFRKNRKGQTAIEYALIVGGVSIVAYSFLNSGLLASFKKDMSDMGGKISGELEDKTANID
jgi:Flp pilus assembly pilin Flp